MTEADAHLTRSMVTNGPTPSSSPEPRMAGASNNADAIAKILSEMKWSELPRLANFVLVDVRLIFVIVSVYITISSAIMSAANNEAAADANGNGTFDLSSRSGGQDDHHDILDVSNAVLWNCREQAVSRRYYRLLYGSLLGSFGFILLVFLLTRLSIIWGNTRSEMNHLHDAIWHIQIIKCLRYHLKNKKIYGDQDTSTIFGGQNTALACNKLVKSLSNGRWPSRDTKDKLLLCSLLIIPFSEAVCLIVSLPFMLTTYDLNPIGCLVGPDEDAIEYNNVTGRVQLHFTKGVQNYQTTALVVFLVLMVGSLVVFASLLLLHYLRITKNILKEIGSRVNKLPA